ncbi:MAG TPA: triphosphoribosyl-dephospho-CoA synthase [Gemmatimonadales bacterium]|nr:triphosphoribosyl-dephospho-CoA synthase [Gemmatimonadales bacterium]
MDQADLSALATLAAILEASAPKPGNVTPGRPFRDMRYEDFVASAIAAGPELGAAGARPLGETILAAVHATRRWTAANTNLGIILLFAPIAAAQELGEVAGRPGLRRRLGQVLRQTTVDDAIRVYAAIREAGPGGMGTSAEQDLSAAPTVTLVEAMRLAAERDLVAREYTTDFALTFECGLPALRGARVSGLAWPDAIVETFLTLLAQEPDTLIARKLGRDVAESISFRAAQLLRTGGPRSPHGREAIAAFDAELRDAQNSRNPGTTADLTAAALFVSLIEDGWDTDRSRTARAQ